MTIETVTSRSDQSERLGTLTKFQRVGLRCNPFRVLDRSEFAEVFVDLTPEFSPQSLIDHDSQAIQIIGRSGHGKSSLLRAIQLEIEARYVEQDFNENAVSSSEFIYLPPERYVRIRRPAACTRFLLIDEAQRLSRRSTRVIRAWCKTSPFNRLVLGTHLSLDLSPISSTEIHLTQPTRGQLQSILQKRIDWARLSDASPLHLSDEAIDWLLNRSGGNLQLIERVLYDVVQNCIDDSGTIETPNYTHLISPMNLQSYDDQLQEMRRLVEVGEANSHRVVRPPRFGSWHKRLNVPD